MDRSLPDMLATTLLQSRRTMLGAIVGGAATATTLGATARKKKKKKTCKAPTTRCGKSQCCQPGQTCANGRCATPVTTTPPAPLTSVQCPGPRDNGTSGGQSLARTFVANGSGQIASASFDVSNLPTGSAFAVEIRPTLNGVPAAAVLGTAVAFNLPDIFSTPETITVTFDPKIAVQAGVTYALMITDVANKSSLFGVRDVGICAGTTFFSVTGSNFFTPISENLIFTVSP